MAKDLNAFQVGIASEKGVNSPRPDNARGRNVFPQSYKFLTTDRYGEYSPFYWAKCERGDTQNLAPRHDLHTFTLKSPMVSDVTMTKSYFKIPMHAIYPRTWDKQFTIPTLGDDVPSDCRALLNVTLLVKRLISLFNSGNSHAIEQVKIFTLLELICSNASLFARFNQHFNFRFTINDDSRKYCIDELSDIFWPLVVDNDFSLIDDDDHFINVDHGLGGDYDVSPYRYVELIRSNNISFSDSWSEGPVSDNFYIRFFDGYDSEMTESSNISIADPSFNIHPGYINIEPIIAYQLSCAQFCTNDFVDFIYSAQLYRDNMQSLASPGSNPWPTFLYNGVNYQYDVFSQKILNSQIDPFSAGVFYEPAYDFWYNLFSYRNSLRYGDYFTGGKPQPLAVGEYSAPVVNNEVSAIDVTRSIQMQRLLHRVNMVGRKIGDYLSGIFGGQLPEAPKDVPLFLALQKFSISGFETENTSSSQLDQQSITSHLRSSDSKHAYEVQIDQPCYIIGINFYETYRIYSRTMDRFSFHHDRYDDFIPEMQYIGDQDIKLQELDSSASSGVMIPFAYCLRYMEYKQRYGYASGGFIRNLPSWSFITDNTDGNRARFYIDPSYIRSSPSEFDRFYSNLSGYALDKHFHFIVAHTIETAPVRQMEYTPEILK